MLPSPQYTAVIDDVLALTPQRLHDALYCTAPVGMSTLTAHLASLGIDNSGKAIDDVMNRLITSGVRIAVAETVVGGKVVKLITLPGQERVA